MVKSFDNALRWRVIFLREKGFTFDEIAETLSASKRFVYKITRLYRNTRGVSDARKRKSKARLINANDLLLIRRLIDEYPGLYLDEIQTWLEHFTGCTFSVPSLDRCLKRMGLSVQKMHIVTRQRNEFERATYRRFISQFKPNQLLFIDESSKDERTIQRKFGRELCGKRLSHVGNFTRGTRFSVLAAVSMDGIKGAHAIEGAYDTAGFEFAMETFVAPSIGSCANGEDCSVTIFTRFEPNRRMLWYCKEMDAQAQAYGRKIPQKMF
ncbi:uncharacterized protein LOC125556694 [Nematostella vectensis]|uniref:uncharacterized protein LOC125556694 n=1 Tax=Nematostella vectensis TaxID=45351 RepID=UPI0020779B7F|nr:uncharacterized protein LOC125556694 [Nematostella vectensis]